VIVDQARAAFEQIREDVPGAGLLAVTSPGRLHADWLEARSARAWIDELLSALPRNAGLVTVHDGHPAALSWLGAVAGQRIAPLGVRDFGQSGDTPDLYRVSGIDAAAIVDAAARVLLDRHSLDRRPH
jgi:pyruvate dehydrogenase E1 component